MRKLHRRAAFLAIILIVAVVIILGVTSRSEKKDVPETACTGPGAAFIVNIPLKGFVAHSPEIVVGRSEIKNGTVKVEVQKLLKGEYLRYGDIISLCPLDVRPSDIAADRPILLFLKGKDALRNEWVPTQSTFGAISANESGDFQVGQEADVYSLQEIQEAIRKHVE